MRRFVVVALLLALVGCGGEGGTHCNAPYRVVGDDVETCGASQDDVIWTRHPITADLVRLHEAYWCHGGNGIRRQWYLPVASDGHPDFTYVGPCR